MRFRGHGSDAAKNRASPPPRAALAKSRRSTADGRVTESYSSSNFLQGQERRAREERRQERPSPRQLEKSRRNSQRKDSSVHGREYLRHYNDDDDDDDGDGNVGSRKMQLGKSEEKSLYDAEFPQRQTPVNLTIDADTGLRYSNGFQPTMTRMERDKNPLGSSSSVLDARGAYVQRSIQFDDGPLQACRTLQSNERLALHSGRMGTDLFLSPPGNLDDGLYKDVDLTYRGHLNQTQVVAREYYEEEEKRMSSSRNVSYPSVESPQSRGFRTTPLTLRKEELLGTTTSSLPLSPDGLGARSLKFSNSFSADQYKGTPNFESARELKDLVYSQGLFSSSRAQHEEYTYHEIGTNRKDDLVYPSDELYRKMQSTNQGDYENRVSTRRYSTELDVDLVTDINQSQRRMGEEVLLDHQLLREEPVPSYLIMDRKLASGRDEDSFSTGGKYLEFGASVMGDRENHLRTKGMYDFGVEAGPEFYNKRLEIPPKPERIQDAYRSDMSHQQSLPIEEVDKYEVLNWVQKRKHHTNVEMSQYEPLNRIQKRSRQMDAEMAEHATRIVVSSRGDKIRQVLTFDEDDEDVAEEDVDGLPSPKASVFSRLQPIKDPYVERGPRRVAPWLSQHEQHYATKHGISTKRKLSIKKRLRYFPLNVEDLDHLDETQGFNKPDKYWKKSGNDHSGRVNVDKDDPSEHKVLSAKHDPPEGSEEFKQLVHKAFLRFYKHVNETSAQRRRYTEEGKAGTLLCSICVSHSKKDRAFVDTHSLVAHSFSSMTGSRVDHLGLHKALCVLMGWNSDVITGNTWVQQVLPVAEAAALKENLILWPPLVIIHNSSIGTKNLEEQKVVTVEGMELILRDLGFNMATTEVCRGKPANQSIMVVKFKPTFSGLQEAERLHRYYSEIKRGRQEFLQFSSSSGDNNEESIGVQVDNVEPLYGYLGIADDLDKLEFETKRRCVVKSKKDIQTIADAPLKTE